MRAHLRDDKNGVFLVTESGKWDFCPFIRDSAKRRFLLPSKSRGRRYGVLEKDIRPSEE